MKNCLRRCGLLLFVVLWVAMMGNEARAEKWSLKVAHDFIRRYPQPDSIHWKGQQNHFSWQAGYILYAMEQLWKKSGDPEVLAYIRKYVDQQVDASGHVADFKPDALDNFMPGNALLFLYEQTGEKRYLTAARQVRDGFRKYPRTADGLFWHGTWAKHQVWVDGLFMGQLFLARYASVTGNPEQEWDEVVRQITLAAEHFQKENGLMLHGWDESHRAAWADQNTGLSAEVWSEGMGWYAVLLADLFNYLPADYPGSEKIRKIQEKLCRGLVQVVDPKTGLWCQVVDKPGEPGNWNETSGSGMYLYLLKRSADRHYLKNKALDQLLQTGYAALIKKAVPNPAGHWDLIDCSSIGVQKDYAAYVGQPHEVSPFAAFGSFLLATTAIEYP
ncbi:MAG: glycoside hydrolase family 88 protein [Marinilabiliales bacterium]|nr:glycoside hydrolase family 88 protein [Marinilabiliales bacterium]